MTVRAIAYLDGFPWLSYSFEHLKKLISDIESNYRDLLENRIIDIKDEDGNEIIALLPKRAKHYPKNIFALEEKGCLETETIYVDQFNYIL
jgi:hypothetical protein